MSPHSRSHGEAGFTLPEALIATVLTLVVLGAGMRALMDGARLGDMTRRVTDTNQGLQAGMALMTRDFMQTGQGIPIGGIPLPSGAGSAPVVRPAPPAAGLTFPANWTALPAVSPGAGLGPVIRGQATDILTILYADPTLQLSQWPLAAVANNGSTMTVDPRTSIAGADGLRAGDVILFSGAGGNALQVVTSVQQQIVTFNPGDALNLNQRGAANGSIMALKTGAAFPPITATRVLLVSYYIDAVTDPAWPRLVRQVNAGTQPAVALGVENLQFSFDFVDGLTNPANRKTPPAGNSANQIRKINTFVSGRSQDLDPTTHAFFRNTMASQVSLRSLSFVDRYR